MEEKELADKKEMRGRVRKEDKDEGKGANKSSQAVPRCRSPCVLHRELLGEISHSKVAG